MKIDPNSHVPIFLQIAGEIRAAVASGVYRPDEALPSVRALALDLLVNPNTVQRAYEELERDGLIDSRRGVGAFVRNRGDAAARLQAEEAVDDVFRHGIQLGQAANIPVRRLRVLFAQALSQSDGKAAARP